MTLDHFLQQAVLVLGVAVVVMLLCHRLRLPSLVALLLTGVVLGPSGLALVADPEAIHLLAEIGVVLLLFTIGLELSPARLAEVRRPFFLGGSLQASATFGMVFGIAAWRGARPAVAVFLGFILVLSSTAVVLKLYGDRRETEAPHGKVALAILLFQDFLIVPMIVVTPLLGGVGGASPVRLALRFGGALAALALLFVVARRLLPRLFRQLVRTRTREVFVLGALGSCLALAWLTHSLGFSLALGAFVAGLLVSETEYSHQVVADVAPFRDVFASLFFVSLGMLVDVRFAATHAPAVLGVAAAVVAVKAVAGGVAVAALRFPARTVVSVALGLAQIGEFSFVLMEVGRSHALLGGELYQLLLAAAAVTLLVTPGLVWLGPPVSAAWWRLLRRTPPPLAERSVPTAGHVVVVGFGVAGSLLARVLRETGIAYTVVELNGETVRRALGAGEPIVYGDATRPEILRHVGAERAACLVVAIPDRPAARRIVTLARRGNPHLEIIVRSRAVDEIAELRRRGADQVVAEELETAIEIFTRVLEGFHVPRNVVRAQTRALRGEGYRMLRAPSLRQGVSEAVLEAIAAGATEVLRIEARSAAVARTLRELDLRGRSGATVIAVVRDGRPLPNPSSELVLAAGDDLVLVGSHAEIERALELLE